MVMGVLFGRVFADVLDVLVHFEGLLVDVVGEVLLLAALGTRTHVPHYIFKFKHAKAGSSSAGISFGMIRLMSLGSFKFPCSPNTIPFQREALIETSLLPSVNSY